MSLPTAQLALERGHEVLLVVEGLAADRFQEAGFFNSDSKAKLVLKGPEDHRETSFAVDAKSVLMKLRPDVVVATMSFPDSLEVVFGKAANELGIPLVLLEDYWGGHKRLSTAKPDVLIAVDEYAQTLAEGNQQNYRIVIAGNPTVFDPNQAEISAEVRERVEGLRAKFGRVFIFAGGAPEQMTEELKLLIKCLRLTKDWCLIARPHPTVARSEKEPGLKWSEYWNEMLAEFGEQIVSVDCKAGDQLAMLCDATIAGFSMMLNTAASAGRAAISLNTEAGRKELSKTGDFPEVPIVALGCARTLLEPCDLDAAGLMEPIGEENLAKLRPFDPMIALRAIEDLV